MRPRSRSFGVLLAVALSWSLAGTAVADTESDFSRAWFDGRDLAKKASAQGRYAEAEKVLRGVHDTFSGKAFSTKQLSLAAITRLADVYRQRAEWATTSATDAKAARALLLSLLEGPESSETAKSSDKRVAELLASLRKLDPSAKAFFTERRVRVVVRDQSVKPAHAQALADGVVGVLRDLGFKAATTAAEGEERLVLTMEPGEVITNVDPIPFASSPTPPELMHTSCEFKVGATWTAGSSTLISVDLTQRGAGFADISGACERNVIAQIVRLTAARLVRTWDAQHAL